MGAVGLAVLVLHGCLSNPTPHPGRPDAGRGDDLSELGPSANDDSDARGEGADLEDCGVAGGGEVQDALAEVLGGCGDVGLDEGDAGGGEPQDADGETRD
jgi:hypothetical protein